MNLFSQCDSRREWREPSRTESNRQMNAQGPAGILFTRWLAKYLLGALSISKLSKRGAPQVKQMLTDVWGRCLRVFTWRRRHARSRPDKLPPHSLGRSSSAVKWMANVCLRTGLNWKRNLRKTLNTFNVGRQFPSLKSFRRLMGISTKENLKKWFLHETCVVVYISKFWWRHIEASFKDWQLG